MDYIEEMYRQMLASQGRMPASRPDMTVYSQQNVTPGWQKEAPTVIEAMPPEPIEYPKNYKVQVPQSEIIRENVNEALKSQMQEKSALADNVKGAYSEREQYKSQMNDALERMRSMSEGSYKSPEVDSQIELYQKKMMEPRESVAPRDTMAELILTLGPALGGLVGGESGALAAPGASKASRDIYEYQRKEEIDRVKNLKDSTEKKLKTLIDLKKSGQESFDKSAERGLGRIKAELEATKSLATMSNDDLKRAEDNLMKINSDITKEVGDKSVDIAKMERSKWESEQKTKRTPKFMKPLKAGEVAGVGDPLPGFTWNRKTSFTPGDLSKLQSAASDRETLNSLLTKVADKVQNASKIELSNPMSAVRRTIESDLADAQLLYKGESFANLGVLTGPDVSYLDKVLDPPSFANAMMRGGPEEALKRYSGAVDRINERFNSKLKFKGFTPKQPLEGMKLPPKKSGLSRDEKIERLNKLRKARGL